MFFDFLMCLYLGKEQNILPGSCLWVEDYKYDSPGGPGVKASARHMGQISFDLKVILSIYVLGRYQKTALPRGFAVSHQC